MLKSLSAYWILDSRGNPTVEVVLELSRGKVFGRAPAGASKGEREAKECRDGGRAFHGRGVECAVKAILSKTAELKALPFEEWDSAVEGMPANASTALSMAAWKALALEEDKPLWQLLAEHFSLSPSPPALFSNMINGGVHASSPLAIQEFMYIADKGSTAERVQQLSELYHGLKGRLAERYGRGAVNVGDEGGFVPPASTTAEVLEVMVANAEELGYPPKLALDAAANSFWDGNAYRIDGRTLSPGELLDFYRELSSAFPIYSIEDPFAEEHGEWYGKLRGHVKVVSDDLTVTNPAIVEEVAEMGWADLLLLKVNQVGTLSKAMEAHAIAKAHGWDSIVSHRSGETEDTFIAHLAYAVGFAIKAGAPARGERTAKYNELLRIEGGVAVAP